MVIDLRVEIPDLINSDFKKSAASSLPNLPINSALPPRDLIAKLATGAGPPRRFSLVHLLPF